MPDQVSGVPKEPGRTSGTPYPPGSAQSDGPDRVGHAVPVRPLEERVVPSDEDPVADEREEEERA